MTDVCTRCGEQVELDEAHAHGLDLYHPHCCPDCWGTRQVTNAGFIAVFVMVALALALLLAPMLIRGPKTQIATELAPAYVCDTTRCWEQQ